MDKNLKYNKQISSFKDIFNLNLKYIEYIIEKSQLSHQYLKNYSLSGSECEMEIRSILSNIIPSRFHVTHGYIISADSRKTEPEISPQIDVIIVDTLVPHSIYIVRQIIWNGNCSC